MERREASKVRTQRSEQLAYARRLRSFAQEQMRRLSDFRCRGVLQEYANSSWGEIFTELTPICRHEQDIFARLAQNPPPEYPNIWHSHNQRKLRDTCVHSLPPCCAELDCKRSMQTCVYTYGSALEARPKRDLAADMCRVAAKKGRRRRTLCWSAAILSGALMNAGTPIAMPCSVMFHLCNAQKARSIVPTRSWTACLPRWAAFEKQPPRPTRLADIPWPPDQSHLLSGMVYLEMQQQMPEGCQHQKGQPALLANATLRSAYRKAAMRYHPDKFMQRYGAVVHPADWAEVAGRVKAITQSLNVQWEAV